MVDVNQMMNQIEKAYKIYGTGDYYMPPRQSIEQSDKQIVYMPVFANKMIGTKIMSIFPENYMYNNTNDKWSYAFK